MEFIVHGYTDSLLVLSGNRYFALLFQLQEYKSKMQESNADLQRQLQASKKVNLLYFKVPKFLDARNYCCNLPKIQTKTPKDKEFHQKGAIGISNSEDPDLTAPLGSV